MKKLTILWTSGDPEEALDMLLMYTLKSNTNRWWDECNLISWGPSNRLVASDPSVQDLLAQIRSVGVKFYACLRCADRLGLRDKLEEQGFEVILMGEPFTQFLQDPDMRVISV